MDILSAYNQVPMPERNIPNMAFTTKYCLFEFTTMLFGLMTAPATYQWLMELMLSGLRWSLCLIYLDDMRVFSRDFNEQVDQLYKVLTWLGSAVVKLKGSKWVLFSTKVSFLGKPYQRRESCQIQRVHPRSWTGQYQRQHMKWGTSWGWGVTITILSRISVTGFDHLYP